MENTKIINEDLYPLKFSFRWGKTADEATIKAKDETDLKQKIETVFSGIALVKKNLNQEGENYGN